MSNDAQSYEGEGLSVRFDAELCIHSRRCVLDLPNVFRANVEGPWIQPNEADAEELAAVIRQCPSGALSFEPKKGLPPEKEPQKNVIAVQENGPLSVRAQIQMNGQSHRPRAVLCRCGASANKPYCDGSHTKIGFRATGEPDSADPVGTLTGQGPLELSVVKDGPLIVNGPLEIICGSGRTIQRTERVFLCRCGGSGRKPFCDGTHSKIGFTG